MSVSTSTISVTPYGALSWKVSLAISALEKLADGEDLTSEDRSVVLSVLDEISQVPKRSSLQELIANPFAALEPSLASYSTLRAVAESGQTPLTLPSYENAQVCIGLLKAALEAKKADTECRQGLLDEIRDLFFAFLKHVSNLRAQTTLARA